MSRTRSRAQLYADHAERLRAAAASAEFAQGRAELLRLAELYDRLAIRVVAWSLRYPPLPAANANDAAASVERA
jgi:hypothetical protein